MATDLVGQLNNGLKGAMQLELQHKYHKSGPPVPQAIDTILIKPQFNWFIHTANKVICAQYKHKSM